MLNGERIVVVGAGIGGLAVTLGLARAGADVSLYERAAKIEQVGAGIGLATNAMRCLDALGVGDRIRARGNYAGALTHYTADGGVLLRQPDRTVWIHRAELQSALLDAIEPERVELGKTFAGFTQDAGGVDMRFGDGTEVRCELLLGADGLRSAVRDQLFGRSAPDYTGITAWRGVLPYEHEILARNNEIWGVGSRFGMFGIGQGQMYWYGTIHSPQGATFLVPKDGILTAFGQWMAPVAEVIDATPAGGIFQTDMYDREAIPSWGKGRVMLLGDAAHPMTADLGQGCAQVLEDALAIRDCAIAHQDVATAMRAYERMRVRRANWILRSTHAHNRIGHWGNRLACLMRDELLIKRMPQPIRLYRERRLLDGVS